MAMETQTIDAGLFEVLECLTAAADRLTADKGIVASVVMDEKENMILRYFVEGSGWSGAVSGYELYNTQNQASVNAARDFLRAILSNKSQD